MGLTPLAASRRWAWDDEDRIDRQDKADDE